ncbi:MAG: hypothetical protein HOO96_04135 [Polyangiaceae bacterium]|nr:hypothetical protein [Polyangiaceae bacterium]
MAKPPVDVEGLVARVVASLEVHAALPAAELRAIRKHLPALRPQLEERGFEVGTQVRRPLRAQLESLIADGFVPLKGIEKRVAGATAREVKAALQSLVDEGRLREVVRVVGPGFMSTAKAAAFIEQADLAELLRRLGNAQRLVKRAIAKKGAKSRPALIREELAEPLRTFLDGHTDAPVRATGLTQAIHAQVAASARPLRVPDVLRALGVGPDAGKRALLEGASAGMYGLEPESGMARLGSEDAAWCPEGPQGTRLSWIVAREERSR